MKGGKEETRDEDLMRGTCRRTNIVEQVICSRRPAIRTTVEGGGGLDPVKGVS